jgi:V/A-type H+-transporting ATPase subunit I
MQRVAVLGLREERKRVVSILYDLGVVQIEPLSKSAAAFLRTGVDAASSREVSEELLRIRSLMTALPSSPSAERRGFSSTEELFKASRSIDIDSQVSQLKQDQNKLDVRLDDLKNRIDLVTRLSFVNEDLNIFDVKSVTSFFGTLPPKVHDGLLKSLASIHDVMTYSSGKDPVNIIVVVPTAGLEAFGSIIQKADVRLQRIPPMNGTPTQVLSILQSEKQSTESQLGKITEQLVALSKKWYGLISSVEEQLSIEGRKLEIVNNFGFTDDAFALEGWVPEHKLAGLEEVLSRLSSSTKVFRIEGDSKPPTLLENPQRLKFFESFIRFYTIPQSNEFDPTIMFALAFPIFFGFMLGDVGYAVAIMLISIWIIRRVDHPERRTLIPLALRSFATKILKPVQFRKLARAMILGSVVGIVMGFVLNAYFGFQVNQYLFTYLNANFHLGLPSDGTFLNPISTLGLKLLLLYSGYIGLFMVSLGLVLGMINAYWMQERKHIISKLGWLFVAWGLALFGLMLFRRGDVNPASNPIAGVDIGAAVVGIGLIIYGEGGLAVIELPSIVSHIISFTRLLGILLASFVLAYVIDKEAVGSAGSPGLISGGVGFAIAGIVLLLMGHVFNLVLGILEPGIQGARLLYVETFSKFLHGGGKPFSPFKGGRTHTVSELDLMESKSTASTGASALLIKEELKPVPTTA